MHQNQNQHLPGLRPAPNQESLQCSHRPPGARYPLPKNLTLALGLCASQELTINANHFNSCESDDVLWSVSGAKRIQRVRQEERRTHQGRRHRGNDEEARTQHQVRLAREDRVDDRHRGLV